MVAKAREGYDLVIGSRYVPGGDTPDFPPQRVALSWTANAITRIKDPLQLAYVTAFNMNLPTETLGVMIATLLLGTPVLSLIGSISVGLNISLKRGGQLLSLLVCPF